MFLLVLAAIVFDAVHLGIAGSGLRQSLVRTMGRMGYMAAFSAVSLATLAWLVVAYKSAPYAPTWGALQWWKPAAIGLMAAAFVLGAAGAIAGSAGGSVGATEPAAPRGIHRVTRHPLLVAVTIWAIVHLIGNGDFASLIFFASFAVMSVAGIWSMDRRKRMALGEAAWSAFAQSTSIIPFGAIARGRNRLDFNEIGITPLAIGLAAFALVLGAHPYVIGVSPLP